LKLFAVIYGDGFGRIPILRSMAGRDSDNTALTFMESRMKEILGQVYNVKEKIILLIDR
jgi:hypothetical protein